MRVQRRYALFGFVVLLSFSLACTLGGSVEPTPSPTALAQVSPSPASPTPTSSTVATQPSITPDTPTPTSPPTNTPTHTPTPIVGNGPGGCVLRGTYISDVTIPDGTVLSPNSAFVKTWRVRNDGTCAWDAGYQLAFSDGNQMSGPAAVNIPSAAPGQTIDVSVNLVAPGAIGDYTGRWRLRASNNAIFGGYTVVIKVVGTPTPTATATQTSTPVGGGIWGGTWLTTCESATCGEMNLVQSGSSVTGLYANGTGSIVGTMSGNRLSGTWSRSGSSGTFDFWIEGERWHGNYNSTFAWCGHRAGQSDFVPCGVADWYGTWTTNFDSGVPCGDMTLSQSGDSVTGNCAGGGSIVGTVNGTVLEGRLTRNPGSPSEVRLPFKFYMLPGGDQFQGNFSGAGFWCGGRNGQSPPTECFKP